MADPKTKSTKSVRNVHRPFGLIWYQIRNWVLLPLIYLRGGAGRARQFLFFKTWVRARSRCRTIVTPTFPAPGPAAFCLIARMCACVDVWCTWMSYVTHTKESSHSDTHKRVLSNIQTSHQRMNGACHICIQVVERGGVSQEAKSEREEREIGITERRGRWQGVYNYILKQKRLW